MLEVILCTFFRSPASRGDHARRSDRNIEEGNYFLLKKVVETRLIDERIELIASVMGE